MLQEKKRKNSENSMNTAIVITYHATSAITQNLNDCRISLRLTSLKKIEAAIYFSAVFDQQFAISRANLQDTLCWYSLPAAWKERDR